MIIDSNINFKGIHYSQIPLRPEFIKNLKSLNRCPGVLDVNPSNLTKEIMEQAPIFRDLDAGTDIFVNTMFTENERPMLGVLYSSFVNPYNNKPEALTIQAEGFSKEIIFEKIKTIANKLPFYNELKESVSLAEKPFKLKVSDQWYIE